MENHLSVPSKPKVLIIPITSDNRRSLVPVRTLYADISEKDKINSFLSKFGHLVGTSKPSKAWQMESHKILPTPNSEYTGVVIVEYSRKPFWASKLSHLFYFWLMSDRP